MWKNDSLNLQFPTLVTWQKFNVVLKEFALNNVVPSANKFMLKAG